MTRGWGRLHRADSAPIQVAEIRHLADLSPRRWGCPRAVGPLANLRAYPDQEARIVKSISREHLRRLLKKGGFVSAAPAQAESVPDPQRRAIWPGFAGFGGTYRERCPAFFFFRDVKPVTVKAMEKTVIPRPSSWCFPLRQKTRRFSLFLLYMSEVARSIGPSGPPNSSRLRVMRQSAGGIPTARYGSPWIKTPPPTEGRSRHDGRWA